MRVSRAPNSYAGSPALRNQWSAETLMSAIKAMDGDAQLEVLQNLAEILPDSPSQLEDMKQAWYHNSANMYLNLNWFSNFFIKTFISIGIGTTGAAAK